MSSHRVGAQGVEARLAGGVWSGAEVRVSPCFPISVESLPNPPLQPTPHSAARLSGRALVHPNK
jgi:hypothetical protein